jgi:hypothetical protein
LLLLTIEGRPGNIEVQAWLSTFSLQPLQVEAFGKKVGATLTPIFLNG